MNSTFSYSQHAFGNPRCKLNGCFESHFERMQIAIIYADDRSARIDGGVEFAIVVYLNQRGDFPLLREFNQAA